MAKHPDHTPPQKTELKQDPKPAGDPSIFGMATMHGFATAIEWPARCHPEKIMVLPAAQFCRARIKTLGQPLPELSETACHSFNKRLPFFQ